MGTAVIALCEPGARLGCELLAALPAAELYVHESVAGFASAKPFARVVALTAEIFRRYRGLVYIMPCGVVVRAVAPVITHKLEDPAVVVVDVGGRWAVSLLSGHEGGANELAVTVGNILAAEPVISTSTEALKDLIVGVGCRRGTAAARIEQAVRQVLDTAGLPLSRVRYLASADLKKTEAGLLAAAQALGVPLRFISSSELRTTVRADFTPSAVAKAKVGLPAVAEPVALLAGRRTELFVPRQIVDGVTVAVARERCMWSA